MKKGANLALEILIVAIILLVVMVIILYIFGSKASFFSKATNPSCQEKNGVCLGDTAKTCDQFTSGAKPIKTLAKGCVSTGAGYQDSPSSSELGQCCIALE